MPDERGSIAGLVDNAGTTVTKNSYDEYGIPGSANQGRFQYTGQAWLPELGCYHYKARIYCPTLGRFLQVDPVGWDDQINMYAYVGNDAVNKADPSGEEWIFNYERQDKVKPNVGGNSKPKVSGSSVAGTVAQSQEALADAGRATGASAKDVVPVRSLGHAFTGLGGALKAQELAKQNHSTTASVAGGAMSEAPGAIFGAVIGTFVEPGGGTIVFGAIGAGLDELLGLGDKAGDATANIVDNPDIGPIIPNVDPSIYETPTCKPMAAAGC